MKINTYIYNERGLYNEWEVILLGKGVKISMKRGKVAEMVGMVRRTFFWSLIDVKALETLTEYQVSTHSIYILTTSNI